MSNTVWSGKAFCTLSNCRPEYQEGFRGAYVVFVCSAVSISEASRLIETELFESELILKGFEYFFDVDHMDRQPSEYEEKLISRLDSYPVQFENVHFFKPDS